MIPPDPLKHFKVEATEIPSNLRTIQHWTNTLETPSVTECLVMHVFSPCEDACRRVKVGREPVLFHELFRQLKRRYSDDLFETGGKAVDFLHHGEESAE